MSKEKFCPECGEKIDASERFCPNCGADVVADEPQKVADTPIVGAGSRANIMGGIHQSSSSNTNVNSSSVDNSSTVNHNTTYVMNEKKKEFCEVCGNPLEEKHARCPKCGKEICADCKVKGKARCVECEKKAINEYRVAFQQLQLTTNGEIGVAGRQMMDQKARELDVEDVKASIEKELIELYKPVNRAVQPEVIPTKNIATTAPRPSIGTKSMNTDEIRISVSKGNNGSKNLWFIVVALLVVIVGGLILWNKKGTNEQQPAVTFAEEKVQQSETNQKTKGNAVQPVVSQPVVVEQPKAVSQPTVVEQPKAVVQKTDADYDAGMKAYEAGQGLEAINAFKASGSAKAYYMLGVIYEKGCGNVGKNAMMARKNFKKAAQLGSEEAKAKL